ncbi:RNA polymerase sigma factor [Puniceicoccaceae bacterium K14]|nr:RNA polymerase sigma factor [Puniceicoccaceae bacterium K14]
MHAQSQADIAGAAGDRPSVDNASFALLVHQHHAKVCNFIYRYTGNKQDAEDLTQDTFVKAFRNFHRYDSKYAFSSWLFTIARRTAYNHFRGKKYNDELDFEVIDSSDRPDDLSEKGDESDVLWDLVKTLKKEYREVLMLKYIDDLQVKEIAQVLNKSQTNIKILLFRARNQLKRVYEKKGLVKL